MSRNKREGRYAGHCPYGIGHIRGGNQSYEFNTTKEPRANKALYIAGIRYRNGRKF